MKRRRWLILATVVVVLMLSVWAKFYRGRGPAPLDQSPFLRDVVEPITIVTGMSFDDGGSQGLRFKDARGTVRDLCLEDTRIWEKDPTILEGHNNIILNSFFPRDGLQVPISGVEERAVFGLLERWARHDPDAQELERRFNLLKRHELTSDEFWNDVHERFGVKITAVSILRKLRARN